MIMTLLYIEFWKFLVLVIFSIVPIIALVDILFSKFKSGTKILWLVIVVFLNIIGAILYLIMGRKNKIPK